MQTNITWVISTNEAAYILNALAKRPYEEVNQLIGKLHKATNDQVAQMVNSNGNNGAS